MDDPPPLPGVRHEVLQAGSVRMHVALAGADENPPVLLVHGWPQNWWCWRHVIPQLQGRYRVLAPDLRGHGWSEAPRTGYEKDQLASDLLALLDTLGIERVTWVGHDWGAYAGFLAALREPQRLERMLALAIPHPWSKASPQRVATLLSYQAPISAPLLGSRIADAMVRRSLQIGRGGDRLDPADVDLFARRIPPRVTVAMYRTFLVRELPAALRGRFAGEGLQVPTTLITGARDRITAGAEPGPAPGQPALEVEVLDGVAHWIPEQRPEAIAGWLGA